MRYEMMFPDQIREAIDNNVPVVLALGVLEYHGEHMTPGVDTLLVIHAIDIIEKEMPLVILPPFYYGFRNVHVFIHHQCENFAEGMPTDLAFKLAARQETFAFIEREKGEGWWGDNSSADYYENHAAGDNPFNWIRIHPFMSKDAQVKFPVDHAGEQETSLMIAFCPEAVDMNRFSDEKWYLSSAKLASLEYGSRAKEIILSEMKKLLIQ